MKRKLYMLNRSILILLLSTIFGARTVVISQELQEAFWQTNEAVQAFVTEGNIMYIGGAFTAIGPPAPNLASLDVISAQPNLQIPKVNGEINAVISDGAGGLYIGGTFTMVGDSTRNRLAHILADNSVGVWNPSSPSTIHSLALGNGVVYVAGDFFNWDSKNHLAAIDMDGNLTSWDPQVPGGWPVYAVEVADTIIYFGGGFQTIAGETRNRLAAVGISGALLPWNPDANNQVRAITIHNNVVYVGGTFSTVGGQSRIRTAAIDFSGSVLSWTADLNTAAGTQVYTIRIFDNIVYIGGVFTEVNGTPRTAVAAIDLNGSVTSWAPVIQHSTSPIVYGIYRKDNAIFIGGGFSTINGIETGVLGSVDANTGATLSWNAALAHNIAPRVKSLFGQGTDLFVGGLFNIVNAQKRNRIAAIDLTDNSILPWSPDIANGGIRGMVIKDEILYIGGNFTSINGNTRNRLAAFNLLDGSLADWDPNSGGNVISIDMKDTVIYVGGAFTLMSGQTRNRLAAVSTSGNLLDWNPNVGSGVNVVLVQDTTVYIGGLFTTISGQTRNRLAAVSTYGNLLDWNPNSPSTINSIVIHDTTVYVGGMFTTMSGEPRQRLAAVSVHGNLLDWTMDASSTVNMLKIASNNLYIGGPFTTLGGITRQGLGSVDLSTGMLTNWAPTVGRFTGTPIISAFETFDQTLYVGGSFDLINGKIHQFFAAITDPSLTTPTTFQLTVNIEDEWNIVSIPGLHPVNQGVDTWWSGRNPSTFVFGYDEGYYSVTEVEPGKGYWMEHIGANTYNTGDEWPAGGINIVPNASIDGNEGWNLIGGYHYNAPVNGITTTPTGLQTGLVWGYSSTGGYQAADDLIPGYGYWIELTGEGEINLPDATFKSSGKFSERIGENWGRIIITDRTGKSYTLYGVNGDVNLKEYNLPPVPPAGKFDIRYGSGRIAEDLSAGTQMVEMKGISYPVTVKVENMSARIQDASGEIVDVELRAGEQVVVNNSAVDKLVVLGGEISLPIEYALDQNYPNPFNPSTTIKFSLPEAAKVSLTVFNVLGQKITELVNTKLEAGRYSYQWDASNLSSGIYLYQLKTDNFVSIKKMMLIK